MAQLIRAKFAPLQSKAFGDITGAYSLMATLANATVVYYVQNLTNATMTFSVDGVTDNFILPSMGFTLIDLGANKGLQNQLAMAEGDTLYVKGVATSGSVYLSTVYMG